MSSSLSRSPVRATRLHRSRVADSHDDGKQPQAVDLILSTHMTVVVRARLSFAAAGLPSQEAGLVISRQACLGERPTLQALRDAAVRRVDQARAQQVPNQIQVCIDGDWVDLLDCSVPPDPFRPAGFPRPGAREPSPGSLTTMHKTSTPSRRLHAAAAFGITGLLAFAGNAASAAGSSASAEANYRKERADCLNGHTAQDRQTCLREAGAALQEARRNGLTDPSPEVLARNAVLRCKSQPEADRPDCERLARGEGRQEGTVAQGAIVREITTVQVAPPPAGR